MSVMRAKQSFLEERIDLDECQIRSGRSILRCVRIRRYRESDRPAVRLICCETGFLGRPIDPIYRDRELFADLITNPYLDNEPEWALVAESGGQVVGYLLGSVNPHFHRTLMLSGFHTACKMLTRLLTGKYHDHPRSEQFVRWVLTKGLMEQPNHPEEAAHLHLNLEKEFRRGTVALRLWSIFEDRLRAAGISHYYGEFFSCAQRNPEAVYARYGFKLYDRSLTTMFQPEIPDPVSIVCAHKILDDPLLRLSPPGQPGFGRELHP
jgi:ribosomal protein S18 acetylase RimI-like enzyme